MLSPTDPAILIPLFVASRLRLRVAQTVIAESAFNDPTGAVLALAVAGALLSGDGGIGGPAAEFLAELAISSVVGVLAGVLLSATISSRRTGILRDSAPIAVLAVVAVSYVSLDFAGGSGYLGAFLAGPDRRQHGAARARDALATTRRSCGSRRARCRRW